MSQSELYEHTLRSFSNALAGFHDLEETRQKQSWERVRWQTWLLLNIQIEKQHKLHKPQDLATFPWEEGEEKKILSKEDVDAIFSRFENPDNK